MNLPYAIYQGLLEETGRATPFLCKTVIEADFVDKNFGT